MKQVIVKQGTAVVENIPAPKIEPQTVLVRVGFALRTPCSAIAPNVTDEACESGNVSGTFAVKFLGTRIISA